MWSQIQGTHCSAASEAHMHTLFISISLSHKHYFSLCRSSAALQTSRQHREEQARLLEENASLKSRIAAEAARVAMGVLPGAGVGRPVAKTFAAVGEPGSMGGAVDAWLGKIERWVSGSCSRSSVLVVSVADVVQAACHVWGAGQRGQSA